MKKIWWFITVVLLLILWIYRFVNNNQDIDFGHKWSKKEWISEKEEIYKLDKNWIKSEDENKKYKEEEKEKIFLKKKWPFIWLLDTFIRWFCEWKKNLVEITCSPNFRVFEPKTYYLLRQLNGSWEDYNEIIWILYSKLKKWCKVEDYEMEILIRKIKVNSYTCVRDDKIAAKNLLNMLKDFFKKNKLTENNINAPFDIYYSVKRRFFIPDVEEKKIQVYIMQEIINNLYKQWIDEKSFKSKLMKDLDIDTIEALKEKIKNYRKDLWRKYNFSKCWLNLTGEENYFIYWKIKKNCIKYLRDKLFKEETFRNDAASFIKMIDVYTYLSKDFLWAKFRAKSSFGPEGVGIVEFLDIYNNAKNAK